MRRRGQYELRMGAFSHPDREMQIKSETETVSRHHYTHHVLLMAAIPVVRAFIGTTQIGWNFGDGNVLQLSLFTAFALAVLCLRRDAGGRRDGDASSADGAKLSGNGHRLRAVWFCRLCRDAAVLRSAALYPPRYGYAFLVGAVALFTPAICCIWVFRLSLTLIERKRLSFFQFDARYRRAGPEVLLAIKCDPRGYGYRLFCDAEKGRRKASNAAFADDSSVAATLACRYDATASLKYNLAQAVRYDARESLSSEIHHAGNSELHS